MRPLDPHKVLQRFLRRLERRWRPPERTLDAAAPLKRLPANVREAAKKLIDPVGIKTVAHRNRVSKGQKFDRMHPLMIAFYRRLQAELDARNMPFYPFEFYRTEARQADLLKRGVTKAGPGNSPHNHGCAVDVVHSWRLWDLSRGEWAVIGAIGKEVARKLGMEVTWGGDWSFYDPAHWQLKDWRLWVLFNGEEEPWPEAGTQPERDAYARNFREWRKKRGL
jgi:hypothetical protein